MSDVDAEPKPCELTDEELENATGGVSLSFSKISFAYKPQKDDGTSS
jgi:type VI protein secretion system component Hcp